jgi:hypothetical protein
MVSAQWLNNWDGDLSWTYDGCIQVDSNQFCLKDAPCRSGEPNAFIATETNVICQYPVLGLKYPLINLPQAWNTLEDLFVLYENEFLLSNNKLYKLILIRGNLNIVYVNIFLFVLI